MSESQPILEAASRLPEPERIRLIEGLLATLEPAADSDEDAVVTAWRAEVLRRAAELQSGAVTPVPWSDVRDAGEELLDAGD